MHSPRRLCLHGGTGCLLCPAPGPARRNRGRKRKTPGAFLVLQRAHHESQHVTSPRPATGPGYQPPGCPGQRPRCSRAPRVPNNPLGTSESRRLRRPASREAALFPGRGSWRTSPARVLGARPRRRARAPPARKRAALRESGSGPLCAGCMGFWPAGGRPTPSPRSSSLARTGAAGLSAERHLPHPFASCGPGAAPHVLSGSHLKLQGALNPVQWSPRTLSRREEVAWWGGRKAGFADGLLDPLAV